MRGTKDGFAVVVERKKQGAFGINKIKILKPYAPRSS